MQGPIGEDALGPKGKGHGPQEILRIAPEPGFGDADGRISGTSEGAAPPRWPALQCRRPASPGPAHMRRTKKAIWGGHHIGWNQFFKNFRDDRNVTGGPGGRPPVLISRLPRCPQTRPRPLADPGAHGLPHRDRGRGRSASARITSVTRPYWHMKHSNIFLRNIYRQVQRPSLLKKLFGNLLPAPLPYYSFHILSRFQLLGPGFHGLGPLV
jgi:hypothetical protein